jgi:DNA modification methylase
MVNFVLHNYEFQKCTQPPNSVALVFMDFPYGESDKQKCTDPNQQYKNMQVDWDYSREETATLLKMASCEAWKILKPGGWCVLTATPYAKPLVWDTFGFNTRAKITDKKYQVCEGSKLEVPNWRFQNEVVWCKPNANPGVHTATNKKLIQSQESVFFYAKGFPTTFNYQWLKTTRTSYEKSVASDPLSQMRDFWIIPVENGSDRFHEAQKPEKLLSRVMGGYTNPGDTVVDFFSGSGTSGICMKFGCNYVGFEPDPTYFEKSIRRLQIWKDAMNNREQETE